MIVAVDGPAASGKGTLSRRLAERNGFVHLDTGRTYRAVAMKLRAQGLSLDDVPAAVATARTVDFSRLDDPVLLTSEAAESASRIAVIPELRAALVARQRAFAEEATRGAVLDGRDIGTVVCPDAPVKLYVIATVEERARRRSLELFGRAEGPDFDALLETLRERDARDAGRTTSPLRPADDAHILDNTKLTIDEAFEKAQALVEKARVP